MIRVAIVDDEEHFLKKSKDIVEAYFKNKKEACEIKLYDKPNMLIWDLDEGQYYDIYFIDVEMPKANGLEVAQAIRLKFDEPFIVFVTSHMKYSIVGYEYNAYRYITKDKMSEKIPLALDGLYDKLKDKTQKQYIIETYSKVQKINLKDILYLNIQGKYTYFHTAASVMRDRKPLSKVFAELDSEEFVYADKGCVINLRHVIELGDRIVVMRGGEEIMVSIPQYQTIKKAISAYWRKKR